MIWMQPLPVLGGACAAAVRHLWTCVCARSRVFTFSFPARACWNLDVCCMSRLRTTSTMVGQHVEVAMLAFKAPADWKLRKRFVGPLHVNNNIAAEADISLKLLQSCLDAAYEYNVEVELNKCAFPGLHELFSFHKSMMSLLHKLKYPGPTPFDLTRTALGDCVCFVVRPRTPLRNVTLRHGTSYFRALDVEFRRVPTLLFSSSP